MLSALLLALPALAAAVPASTYPHVRESLARGSSGPAIAPLNAVPNAIDGSYIVVFKDDVPESTIAAHTALINTAAVQAAGGDEFAGGVHNVYMTTLKGYGGRFDSNTLDMIRKAPEVAYVERDQTVWASDIQNSAPWGLARVSHRPKLSLGTFNKYEYDAEGGEGVDAYIIDTGINVNHVSFEGRANWGQTIPKGASDFDGNGHGTHCAGTIGSKDFGVAKKASLFAVKVLGDNGSGSMQDVIGGVDWAATAALAKLKAVRAEEKRTGKRSSHKGSVANMSLGGGSSPTLDKAVNAAVGTGMHFAVAAGNDNKDACNYSPAAAEKAVTVGASTLADERAYFSNYGKCVDIFAPGLNIKSTWNAGNTSVNTISGTSMASPHIAGLLAYLLSLYPSGKFAPNMDEQFLAPQHPTLLDAFSAPTNPTFTVLSAFMKAILPKFLSGAKVVEDAAVAPIPPTITPALLKRALILLASPNLLKDVGSGSPNLLAYNNYTSAKLAEDKFWERLY